MRPSTPSGISTLALLCVPWLLVGLSGAAAAQTSFFFIGGKSNLWNDPAVQADGTMTQPNWDPGSVPPAPPNDPTANATLLPAPFSVQANGAFTVGRLTIFQGGSLNIPSGDALTIQAGAFTGSGVVNNSVVVVVNSDLGATLATLTFGSGAALTGSGGLTINGPGRVTFGAHNAPSVSNAVGALTINSNGVLDLGNNSLTINYGAGLDPDAMVQMLVNEGRAGAAGIISSAALASGNLAVGYKDDPLAHTELIEPTLLGDANLDGKVDFNDFNLLAANFGRTGTEWSTGDFNGDGVTNFADFNLLASNFSQNLTPAQAAQVIAFGRSLAGTPSEQAAVDAFAANAGAVPEPGILPALLLLSFAIRRHRPPP